MTNDECHKAFEAWCKTELSEGRDHYALSAWEAWQAAWNRRAPVAQSVPSGWQLVPIEPTEEMLDAGIDAELSSCDGGATYVISNIYKAMLAATPTPKENDNG